MKLNCGAAVLTGPFGPAVMVGGAGSPVSTVTVRVAASDSLVAPSVAVSE